MQIGMIGLGRMGGNMVRRLLRAGHECVVWNRDPAPAAELAKLGARPASSLADLVAMLRPPRAAWLMVPVPAVEGLVQQLAPLLAAGDALVDGGNSPFEEAIRRSRELAGRGIDFLDVGTSGGVWGLERGYCLMIGGPAAAVKRLEPVFRDLAPGQGAVAPTAGLPAGSTASAGYLHCGPTGAGHFVKMVHNGIEYGVMAAYAEGFNLFRHAGAGGEAAGRPASSGNSYSSAGRPPASPPEHAERYRYEFDLPAIAELWRRGSVVSSWLLDLTAAALAADPRLEGFAGNVSDSGEGRWTLKAAIDTATPVPVLSAALWSRFESRGEAAFAGKLLSAMRQQFGGHREPGK
jgi:6-phosphogluconate dehydrogenase